MKFTLKTIVLVALLAFFVLLILSNFSRLEGFVASDSTTLSNTVSAGASSVETPTTPKSTAKSS